MDSTPKPDATAPAPEPAVKHKRRPRYSGKNPRRFEEKYKELDPAKYPETAEKVIAAGKTPAGTHRPIMVREILEVLAPRAGEIVVDATLGYGGHTSELLPRILPGGRLIGLDVDPQELPRTEARLRNLNLPSDALIVRHSNFAGMPQVLGSLWLGGVDMVLADLGCSSMQFDNPTRGFSYKLDGPLDLRMNPNKGRPVSALLAHIERDKLVQLLEMNSDEPHAQLLAEAMLKARSRGPIETTLALTRVLREALQSLPAQVRRAEEDAPIRRVYQALRIEVNGEFDALETFLRFLPACLNPGARVAILTFHSGEDRRVKHAFQNGWRDGVYASIAHEVIRASAEEVHSNPRSSSAKLRWAIKAS